MFNIAKICSALAILMMLGCQTQQASNSPGMTAFSGKVVFEQLEGGFWGIITDSGHKLDGPIPEHLQKNGLQVTGAYRALKDVASFRMWGELVQFSELEKTAQ